MNDTGTCKDCSGPIHWNDSQQSWFHDRLTDILACPSITVEPAIVEV